MYGSGCTVLLGCCELLRGRESFLEDQEVGILSALIGYGLDDVRIRENRVSLHGIYLKSRCRSGG